MKKFFSFAVMLAAAAMVSCCGNANTKSAEAQAEGAVVEAAALQVEVTGPAVQRQVRGELRFDRLQQVRRDR